MDRVKNDLIRIDETAVVIEDADDRNRWRDVVEAAKLVRRVKREKKYI